MTYLDRAIKDGYAIITGPENKQKIIYVTSYNHTENYNDPEEKVRAEFWAELIYEYDYPAHRIKVEVTIPDRVPTDRADIVIFSDDECKKPYAVVECKRDGVTDAEFLQAIEQGVGNATWVKLRASYVVIIAGATRRVLDFSDDSTGILERENNIIADLPKAYGKPQAFRFYRGGEYTDVDGKKKKAPDIQPVAREDLITAIKKCHNTLWGGGRLSPPTAFGELCKLIFVKISDEQKPRKKGEPYQFQIKTHEPSSKLAKRINDLYNEQRLLTWSEKYQITDAQIDTEQNAASNAECIEAIFNRYVRSTEQTIFMSRCFSAEYNETENAIRRAINEINNEKKTGIMLIRVDEHHEGTTGQISDRIFRDIESAGLVIADLSSGKLNVPHEIGYAMGLKKDLILVHNGTSEEAEKHIPSNIRMFEQIRFNGDYQTLQNEIKRRLIDYYKL